MDDTNTWANAEDLQYLAKIASTGKRVRIVATWTTDDPDDAAKLQASDLPRQALLWGDLRPAVVETLLKYEGEVVQALQKFESDRSIGSLGLGALHSPLKDRIGALGDRPKTVYEFIFGLRGDLEAVAEEFRQLEQDDRADIPVLHVAVEQIAGFEKSSSIEEIVAACARVERTLQAPAASVQWVQATLNRQVKQKRLVKVRDQYCTIHRKWAARLIDAGLSSMTARATTSALLERDFATQSAPPERLLRLWSWLRSVNGSRPYVKEWERSLSGEDWTDLVTRCARSGLSELGFLADQMHLLFDGPGWTATVGQAFSKNAEQIAPQLYGATPTNWYSLRELSMVMEHACPAAWTSLLHGWDRKAVADLLLRTALDQFDYVWSTFGNARTLCPGWLEDVGTHLPWNKFSQCLCTVEPGDLRSLFKASEVFGAMGHKLKRSMVRDLAEAMQTCLQSADVEDLRFPDVGLHFLLLCWVFLEDANYGFSALNLHKLGAELGRSLPRHWRSLCELNMWSRECDATLVATILEAANFDDVQRQVARYSLHNRSELRMLLLFLAAGTRQQRRILAPKFFESVRRACEPKDKVARSILAVFQGIDPEAGAALATQLRLSPEDREEPERTPREPLREKYRVMDATGEDYEIDLDERNSSH